jgi:FKBP12-rapamycin complex-associated protein
VGGADNNDEDPLEDLNTRALEVINRIQAKLTGRDFIDEDEDEDDRGRGRGRNGDVGGGGLTAEMQVGRLIAEATSVENLCQMYPGWCPWW